MVIYSQNLKRVDNRQYLFGDFDKDGAKNVDDPKPFDKSVKRYPTHRENPQYFHRAQYGDGEKEVLLSTELRAVERHINKRRQILMPFLNQNEGSKGRLKTVPSTMKKLRTKYLESIKDVAGAKVVTRNRAEVERITPKLMRKYTVVKGTYDDFYTKPKNNVYYAKHFNIKKPRTNLSMEVQVKSKPMDKLAERMHRNYKVGAPMAKFRKEAKRLFRLGF